MTNVDDLIKKINEDATQYEKLAESNSKLVIELLRDFIRSTPELEAVRWEQYTPHFNDGDPCVFSVNYLKAKFAPGVLPDDQLGDGEDGFLDEWSYENQLEKVKDALTFERYDRIEKVLQSVDKLHGALEILGEPVKKTFGDGKQVTVTKEGIDVEDYSHD